jgi:type IV secretory pathway VirB9-like protein
MNRLFQTDYRVAALALAPLAAVAQDASARTVQYHSQDIVPIHAKLKYTTLIEVPATEKIMEAATGDKDFWVVDVVGNFCFVHPAKAGLSSNLNLITDKGNIYSFTLQDVSGTSATPDLKVIVEPADQSSIVAASGPHSSCRPRNSSSRSSNSPRSKPTSPRP